MPRKKVAKKRKTTKKPIVAPDMYKNWKYGSGVDYDYDSHRDCEAHGCDSICRCEQLLNLRVTSVSVEYFARNICDDMNLNTKDMNHRILRYCVDRLVRIYGAYKPESWDLSATHGYYGEEVGSIHLEREVANDISSGIKNLLACDNPIEFVLNQEYDFLLPELQDQKWTIAKVMPKQVHLGAVGHMRKVDREASKVYAHYTGPVGVAIVDGAKSSVPQFRLIDGYHRFVSLMKEHPKTKFVEILINE
jgi:hypothetical protein